MKERKMNHKVGIKLLDDIQLENVMPTYKHLFQKIDICREVAYQEMQSNQERHYQYNFMYDNVFSILGQRGTGKTSVVFTLKEKIKEQYKKNNDVVLPLIIPEVIPENCTVLGWILAIVREEIEDLESDIRELERKNPSDSAWNRCGYLDVQKKESSLSALFEELSQLFYAGQYNPSNEASYYRAIDNSVKQAEDYYKFGKKIAELWDAWVKRIQYRQQLKKEQERVENRQQLKKGKEPEENLCPMIYFIFDDVDLAPEKIEELLSVIIKYLSHPNIIVITTAHEELVLEVIENRLDRNIGRLPRDWRNYLRKGQTTREPIWSINITQEEKEEAYGNDLISQTARMYLGKVLPTSTRYYLKLFNTAKQKELFCLERDENLGVGVKNQIQVLIDCIGGKKQKNFMGTDTEIINFYLKFMGNTSRQISNIYIALQELIINLKDILQNSGETDDISKERLLMQIYQNCRYFLCVAINANHDLSNKVELIDEFVDEVFLPEYNQWKMYYDYSFLNRYLNEKFQKESKQKKIEIGLKLYSLLAFEENILLLLEKGVFDGIAKRKKIHAITFLTRYIRQTAFERRHVFREDLPSNIFFSHYMNLLDRLDVIVTEEISDKKFNLEYFYNFRTYNQSCKIEDLKEMYKNNRKWFHDLIGMLTMIYGNAYLISEENMEECLIYFNRRYLIGYQRKIDIEIKNNIKYCFGHIKMQEIWEETESEFFGIVLMVQDYEYSNLFFDLVEKVNSKLEAAEESFVALNRVLDSTINFLKSYLYDDFGLVKIVSYFPEDILEDIRSMGGSNLESSEKTRSLIQKYIEKIKKVSMGNYVLLRDVENAINILEKCADSQYVSSAFTIRDICIKILDIKTGENTVRLEKDIYMDFRNILINISKNISESIDDSDYWGEKIKLKRDVEELFGDLEVIIEVVPNSPSEEMKKAVELGIWIVFIEILQENYILQTVYEKYENGNSMSSKELEKVKRKKGETDTYYYQIFQCIVNLLEDDTIVAEEGENDLELVDIKEDIKTIYLRERENYVNSLIEGVNDE